MLYVDMVLLDNPHRWQFAELELVAQRGDLHAKVYRHERSAWRAIDSWPNGRAYGMRPLEV